MARVERDENRLFGLMPERDFVRLAEAGERTRVPLGEAVSVPAEPIRYAHFPIDCVFSLIVQMRDGAAAEGATIGNEGLVGVELLSDLRDAVYRVIQQVPGESLRVPAAALREAAAASEPLRRTLERFALTLGQQSAQNAGCNLRHSVEERACRWLVMTHDRVRSDEFFLTQEDLANMLGVRRQSVSLVAGTLQKAGLITFTRGKITVLDRPGLERAACECGDAIRKTYDRVMRPPA